jgi:hypothetical protein
MSRVGVANSNPTEALDITGNLKTSSNMYSMSRIGVGTSNPAYQLHASGTVASSNTVYLSDGTVLLPTIAWSNDLNTGIYHIGNNSIGISTGGSNAITISNNKLGINTLNPEFALDVIDTVHISSNILFGNKTSITSNVLFPSSALAVNNPSGSLNGITYTFISTNLSGNWNGGWWYDFNYNTSLTCDPYVAGVFNGVTATSNVDGSNVIRGQMSGIVGSSNFILKGYRFENSNVSTTTLPSKLYLLGSYDNSNWNTIDYYVANSSVYSTPLGTNITGLDRQVENTSNYRYYRVVFNELLSGTAFVINEFRWYISLSIMNMHVNGLYYNNSNNTYGINTSIPKYTLDVTGDIATSNLYLSSSGTSSKPSLSWISSSNTGIYLQGQNMNMVTSSSNVLSLSNYKVGILSTQPTESLDIIGNLKASSNIYSLSRLSVGKSNPTESLDLIGNIKASSNIYSLSRLGVGTSNPSTSIEINATDAMLLPKGTTVQRPGAPIQGQIRYNTQINTFEGYGAGNAWGSLGGVKDTNQDTYISAESFPTSNDDILRFYNSNIETVRITKDGKIGISNQNPIEKLHLSGGNARFDSNVYIVNTLGVGKINPSARLDVVGNTDLDGIVRTTQYVLSRGIQIKKRNLPYYTSSPAPSGMVVGFSNEVEGLLLSINNNTSSNYFRFSAATSEVFRITGDGNVGVGGISNPSTTLEVNGGVKVRSNIEILGNLTVRGTTTNIDSTTVNIVDNIIRLNNGANYSSVLQSGIEINRGGGYSNYLVVFDEASDTLQTGFQGDLKVVPNIDGSLVSNGILLYDNTNKKITSCNNFVYSGTGLGIGTNIPTEQLDVNKNIKVNSNLYVVNRLGIATSNPTVALEINATDAILIPKGTTAQRPGVLSQGQIRYNTSTNTFEGYGAGNTWGSLGGVKDTNQDTYISAESFPTSNDDTLRFVTSNNEVVTILKNGFVGFSNKSPSERMELSGGNAKFNSNIYVRNRISIGTGSNPTEALDITGNTKISSNLYVINNIGVGLSNPSTTMEINGDIKVRSNLEILGDLTIRGTTTTVDSTTVNIVDNIIRLNNGAGFSSSLQAGFEVNRGAGYSNYILVFDEATDSLQSGFQGDLKAVPNIDGSLISNGVLLYDNTNKKITSCNNFVYDGIGLGIGTTIPTEQLDVNKNIKVNSNLYVVNRLGIATSNPTVSLEINATDAILIPNGTTAERPNVPSQGQIRYNTQINTFEGYGAGNAWGSLGGIKDTNQDTYISAESFPTSNDDTLRFITSNNEVVTILRSGFVGFSNTSPSERLELSGGNAKFNSNIYVRNRISIGTGSNPTESLDIIGNIKASSNIYVLRRQAIGTSNPTESLDIIGNLKTSSNIYAMSRIGLGTSNPNPLYQLHASRTIASSNAIYISDGTALLPTIAWSNDLDTGIYHLSNHSIGISTGGSNALTINNNKIGINTLNPEFALDVIDTVHISSNILFGSKVTINSNILFPSSALAVANPSGTLDGITYTFISTNFSGSWNGNWWYDYSYISSLTCDDYVAGVFNGVTATSNVDGSNVIRGQISGITGSSNFILKGYRFENSNLSTTTLPSKLYLLGSYDNSNWNTIDYYVVNSNVYSTPLGTYIKGLDRQIENTSNYMYYRVVFNELLSGSSFVIQEFRWYISKSILTTYTNGVYYNNSNNYYGINNSNPNYTLDVSGDVAMSNIYLSSSGTSATPSISWVSSSNTGIYLQDQNMNIVTSSSNVLSLSNYKVGILSTQPTESLDISGNLKASSNIYSLSRLSVGKSNPTESLDLIGNIKASSNIYSLSRLSVGKSNPTESLDLIGNIKASSNIYSLSRLSVGKSNPTESLDLIGNIKVSSNIYSLSRLSVGKSNPTESLDLIGNILASQNIYSLGNIGIGTSNPSTQLEINGSAKINSNIEVSSNIIANRSIIHCTNTAFPTIIRADKDMITAFGTNSPYAGDNGANGGQAHLILTGSTDQNKRLAFMYNTTDNFAVIQSMIYGVGGTPLILNLGGGSVGIGNSNPVEKLHVEGKIYSTTQLLGNSNDSVSIPSFAFKEDSNTGLYHPAASSLGFVTGGVERIRIDSVGNIGIGTSNPQYPLHVASGAATTSIFAAGDIIGLSDKSVKADLQIIPNALDKIMSINGYTFTRTDIPSIKRSAGVIAQEVQKVLPEVVTQTEDGKLSVAYGNMIALLIQGIKELNEKLDRITM